MQWRGLVTWRPLYDFYEKRTRRHHEHEIIPHRVCNVFIEVIKLNINKQLLCCRYFARGFIRNHENSLFLLSFINPLLRIPSPSPKSSIPRHGPKPKSLIGTSDETKITWATHPTFDIFHFYLWRLPSRWNTTLNTQAIISSVGGI